MGRHGKRQSHEEHGGNHERWLLTYADMITLLMIFFIIMYSMSIVDAKKFSELSSSLSGVMGQGQSVLPASQGVMEGNPPVQSPPQPYTATAAADAAELQKAMEQVEALIEEKQLGGQLSVQMTSAGVTIRMKDNLLFDSGSATLQTGSYGTLDSITAILNSMQNRIRIEGYTDNVPMHSVQFQSNWELASQRAINVLYYFAGKGVAQGRLSAESFGEFKQMVPNDTSENRQQNRRVDIVIIHAETEKPPEIGGIAAQ